MQRSKQANLEWDIQTENNNHSPLYEPITPVSPDDRGITIQGGIEKWELVKLPKGKYRLADKEFEFPEFIFPSTTIVSPKFSNKVNMTDINGRGGYNIEVVNFGAANVSLKGIIWKGCFQDKVDESGYPYDELALFQNAVCVPYPREIVNEKLTTLGIYRIQVLDWEFPPLDGFPFVQPFSLNAVAYNPLEILSENGQIKFVQSRFL
jgi:hypothetical protein